MFIERLRVKLVFGWGVVGWLGRCGWVGGVIMSSQGFTDLTTYNGLLEGDRKRERTRERQRRRETESGIDRWGRETERKWKREWGVVGTGLLLVGGMARAKWLVFVSSHLLLVSRPRLEKGSVGNLSLLIMVLWLSSPSMVCPRWILFKSTNEN